MGGLISYSCHSPLLQMAGSKQETYFLKILEKSEIKKYQQRSCAPSGGLWGEFFLASSEFGYRYYPISASTSKLSSWLVSLLWLSYKDSFPCIVFRIHLNYFNTSSAPNVFIRNCLHSGPLGFMVLAVQILNLEGKAPLHSHFICM